MRWELATDWNIEIDDDENGAPLPTLRRTQFWDGLAMIEAIASDQWGGAGGTLRRVHEAAVESLRRARLIGLDGSGTRGTH